MTSYPGPIYPALNQQSGDVDMRICEESTIAMLEDRTGPNAIWCSDRPQNASGMLVEADGQDAGSTTAASHTVQVVKDGAAYAEMKQDPAAAASDTHIGLLDVRGPIESFFDDERPPKAAEGDAGGPQMTHSSSPAHVSSTPILARSSSPPSSVIFDMRAARGFDVDLVSTHTRFMFGLGMFFCSLAHVDKQAGSDEEWGAYTSPPPSEDALKCIDHSNDLSFTTKVSTMSGEDTSGYEDLSSRNVETPSTASPDSPRNAEIRTAPQSDVHAEGWACICDPHTENIERATSLSAPSKDEAAIETAPRSAILTDLSMSDATSNATNLANSPPSTGSPSTCLAMPLSPASLPMMPPAFDVALLPLKDASVPEESATPPRSPLPCSSPLPASSLPVSPSPAASASLDDNTAAVATTDSSVLGFAIPPFSRSSSLFAATEKRVEDDAQQEDPLDVDEEIPLRIMSSPGPLFLRDERMVSSSPLKSDNILGKRPGSPLAGKGSELSGHDRPENTPIKRLRREDIFSSPPRPPPAPKRATLASQRLSRKKLATPFRSPLMARPIMSVKTEARDPTVPPTPSSAKIHETSMQTEASSSRAASVKPTYTDKPSVTKTMTTLALASKAASQFRSPFAAGNVPSDSRNAILPTQTIQVLERKLTALRRAVKIKADDDEEKLETLALKWREAGREAAYEFWSIVRDIPQEDGASKKDSGWAGGWGYDEDDKVKKEENDHISLEVETEKAEETLGLMLRRLGIDPETLGWNEEQEIFLDD
ncbi:hypothetical protein EWM64_g4807 [Hericium alpestre]|uniref:Uncharacterized protein n=1 Tax=Hericium alpestre TaxID=135208 RepID=A0A4Z0A098_9AGAM|nr:hypothetical protein EWM64_g4807 [Hericium alpestre]